MTEVMPAQSGLGVTAPSSRQDIVSALLNDYGSSFGSPYGELSPKPTTQKELPLPPTPSKSSTDKPLPPVLTMKFQLRVDEPVASNGQRKDSIESPSKIMSRSISRSGKPRSLKLTKSNGSTALVPQSPAPPAPPKDEAVSVARTSKASEERPLPPPPPEKSERRRSAREAQSSKSAGESKSPRRDSKDPEDSYKYEEEKPVQTAQTPKRKPLPTSAHKFVSLADLQKGPRGRAVTPRETTASNVAEEPLPEENSRRQITSAREATRQPTDPSFSEDETPRNALSSVRPTFNNASVPSQLPSPPEEQSSKGLTVPSKEATSAPRSSPRKALPGLPANPRSGGQITPLSGQHTGGKSSTGFDLFAKGAKPNQTVAPPTLNTITPGLTPSPQAMEGKDLQSRSLASSVQASLRQPVSPESEVEHHRPFSFEAAAAPPPRKQSLPSHQRQQSRPLDKIPTPPVKELPEDPMVASANAIYPPRTTSHEPRAAPPMQQQPESPTQTEPSVSSDQTHEDYLDFVPLTKEPVAVSPQPITAKQTHCYTNHAIFSEFMNRFQYMGCMICGQAQKGPKSSCSWCMLQVCRECKDELKVIPGRDIQHLLANRRTQGEPRREEAAEQSAPVEDGNDMPSVVVWGSEDPGRAREDYS